MIWGRSKTFTRKSKLLKWTMIFKLVIPLTGCLILQSNMSPSLKYFHNSLLMISAINITNKLIKILQLVSFLFLINTEISFQMETINIKSNCSVRLFHIREMENNLNTQNCLSKTVLAKFTYSWLIRDTSMEKLKIIVIQIQILMHLKRILVLMNKTLSLYKSANL